MYKIILTSFDGNTREIVTTFDVAEMIRKEMEKVVGARNQFTGEGYTEDGKKVSVKIDFNFVRDWKWKAV